MATDVPAPVAGLRGMEHVGLTVPDLVQAVDFFRSVLGADVLYEHGPFRADDNWMAVNLGVDARAVIPRIVVLRIANGPTLELFEYEHASESAAGEVAARRPPGQSHVGGVHLAFYVDDIDAGVDSLREHQLIVLGEPKRVAEGPSAGLAWVHFLAPWGQQLDLVSYPTGIRAYEEAGLAVWRPGGESAPPDDERIDERAGSRAEDRDGVADLDTDPA